MQDSKENRATPRAQAVFGVLDPCQRLLSKPGVLSEARQRAAVLALRSRNISRGDVQEYHRKPPLPYHDYGKRELRGHRSRRRRENSVIAEIHPALRGKMLLQASALQKMNHFYRSHLQSLKLANSATERLIQCLPSPGLHGRYTISMKFVEWPVVERVPNLARVL